MTRMPAVLLLIASQAVGQVYRCDDENGNPIFSDRPCSDSATEIDLDVPEAQGVDLGSGGDFSEVYNQNKERELDRKVVRLQEMLDDMQRDHDRKMEMLQREYNALGYEDRDQARRDRVRATMKEERNTYYAKRRRVNRNLSEAKAERAFVR